MKTAILCLALFSIAFALPIAQSPGALRKPEIQQKGSHSADVSHDAEVRERTGPEPVADAPTAVDSLSSDENVVKVQKDAAIVPAPHNIETHGVAPPKLKGSHSADVSQDTEAQEDAAIVPAPHSIDTQGVAPLKLNSHFSDATEDSSDREDPFLPVANDDSNGQETHFSDENAEEFEPEDGVFFDAADDPEFKDVEFADDTLANELASVDEDTDVLTAQ